MTGQVDTTNPDDDSRIEEVARYLYDSEIVVRFSGHDFQHTGRRLCWSTHIGNQTFFESSPAKSQVDIVAAIKDALTKSVRRALSRK